MTDRVKYPIGIQTFSKIREGSWLYVDKTRYVFDIAQKYQYVFLSRPRRFGKSLLTSTFHAYFSGRRELFRGLAIDQLEQDWEQHPVLHFSLATAKLGTVDDLFMQINLQLRLIEENSGIDNSSISFPGARMQADVLELYRKTGKQAVILIDEYDAPMLTVLQDREKLEPLRVALQSFYAPLKDLDPYLRFVFITGITKFSQLSIFSQINNLVKISMMPAYGAICGITQEELESCFKDGIAALSEESGMTETEVLAELKKKYDGYHFSGRSPGVYNPFSLLSAMDSRELQSYWFDTGTPGFLISQMQKFHTDITHTACYQICMALMEDDIGAALTAAQSYFASIPYQEGTLKDAPAAEGHFTAMLYVMFSFLNLYVWSQVRVAKGRMDMLMKTQKTVYVMELKLDGSVDEALSQIDEKGYAIPWQADGRKVVKVGINFSSEQRTISEWKVKA